MHKIKIVNLSLGLVVGLVSMVFSTQSVMAISPTISIQGLPQYTNSDNFKLSCSAMGGNNVQFAFRKESGSYQDFGSNIDITTNPCQVQVTSSQINEQTKYYFKATLDGGVSSETSVNFDISGPSPVSGYYKDSIDSDDYKLHWRNPSDTDFDKVVIYRGETTDFSADSSHEIARISGSPNSDMTYDEHTPDSNKTYYYILRALDKTGNSSGLVGDSGTTTTTTTVTNSASQNGSSRVVQLPKEVGTGGQVLGEETTPEPEVVDITPTQTKLEELSEKVSNIKFIYIGLGLLALVVVTLAIFKKYKK